MSYMIDVTQNSEHGQEQWKHKRVRFQNAIADWYGRMITVREVSVLAFMNQIYRQNRMGS